MSIFDQRWHYFPHSNWIWFKRQIKELNWNIKWRGDINYTFPFQRELNAWVFNLFFLIQRASFSANKLLLVFARPSWKTMQNRSCFPHEIRCIGKCLQSKGVFWNCHYIDLLNLQLRILNSPLSSAAGIDSKSTSLAYSLVYKLVIL